MSKLPMLAFDRQCRLPPLILRGLGVEARDLEVADRGRAEAAVALAPAPSPLGVTVQLSLRSSLSAARAPVVLDRRCSPS